MAESTCPKCDNTSFEIKEAKITGAKNPRNFVQCDKCGAVVAVTYKKSVVRMLEALIISVGEMRTTLITKK